MAKNCRKLLWDLYQERVGNRGAREGNPYMKPEVHEVQKFFKGSKEEAAHDRFMRSKDSPALPPGTKRA